MLTRKATRNVLFIAVLCSTAAVAAETTWTGSWGAAPDSVGTELKEQSVRQVMRLSIGGSQVRIRLSNLFGTKPLSVGAVRIALHTRGAAIDPASDRAVSFKGARTVTIAAGDSALSDPVNLRVTPLAELAISLYLPAAAGAPTQHSLGMQTAYITESGDSTAAPQFPDQDVISSRPLVTDIEVLGRSDAWTIVAFGDSITDAAGSTPDMNRRWPDVLAARLQATRGFNMVGVVNSGISGNRILRDKMGPSGINRFDRDALDKQGVRWIVLLEGINDIGFAGTSSKPEDSVSAAQIIAGMRAMIARAHAKKLKIMGATMTAFGGFDWPYHTISGEAKRQSVNQWIRTSDAFDAIVDFDLVIRDPVHTDRLLPAYDSGDHIHPNDAGCKALADAVDLQIL